LDIQNITLMSQGESAMSRSPMEHKYRLPYHWTRDPLNMRSVIYFGYMEMALNLLPPSPAKVLDAGCGDGRMSAEMIQRGYEVTGCDALDIAVNYAKRFVPTGCFFTADLTKDLRAQSPIDLPTFDAATLIEVYEHIPAKMALDVLRNLHSHVSDEGILILSVPSMHLPVDKEHERHFDRGLLEKELAATGWHIDTVSQQQAVGALAKCLLNRTLDKCLNNQWLQPTILKRLRRKLFQWFCNSVKDAKPCGRLIIKAHKRN
jgi:2-polyprenyl-3-methyl-5-hydroxy-6-metoxy-1,4-benzoquinol methylase